MAQQISDPGWQPLQPLWQRVPTRGGDGRSLADFIMLIPRLGALPEHRRERICWEFRDLAERHAEVVHLVEFNLALGLLWLSVDSTPGVIPGLVAAIRERVPEAVLIGHDCAAPGAARRRAPLLGRIRDRILRLGARRLLPGPPDSGPR